MSKVVHKWRRGNTVCGLKVVEIVDGYLVNHIDEDNTSYWWKDVTCEKCLKAGGKL